MVGKPVQGGGGEKSIAEDAAPLAGRAVACKNDAAPLVAQLDYLVEVFRPLCNYRPNIDNMLSMFGRRCRVSRM